jgi:malate dehydrogenase (oxaloacetate-decarboxylating)(NADP+)
VRAKAINDEMKIAATMALAALAKESIPAEVLDAYEIKNLEFGPEYIVPKPLDRRVCPWVASAVAKAAIVSGVARIDLNIDEYRKKLCNK